MGECQPVNQVDRVTASLCDATECWRTVDVPTDPAGQPYPEVVFTRWDRHAKAWRHECSVLERIDARGPVYRSTAVVFSADERGLPDQLSTPANASEERIA